MDLAALPDPLGLAGCLLRLRVAAAPCAGSLVATYAYVNPVVAVLLGSWLAGEPLNARILLAALIIVGSVVLINTLQGTEGTRAGLSRDSGPADSGHFSSTAEYPHQSFTTTEAQ